MRGIKFLGIRVFLHIMIICKKYRSVSFGQSALVFVFFLSFLLEGSPRCGPPIFSRGKFCAMGKTSSANRRFSVGEGKGGRLPVLSTVVVGVFKLNTG